MTTRHMTYRGSLRCRTERQTGWYEDRASRFTANFMDITTPYADIVRRPLRRRKPIQESRH